MILFLRNKNKEDSKKVENNENIQQNIYSNNFLLQSNAFDSKRNHIRNLEAKLRPIKQRPDSAANSFKFKGLITNDSNISTSTIKNKWLNYI